MSQADDVAKVLGHAGLTYVVQRVKELFFATHEELLGRGRSAHQVKARSVLVYLIRVRTKWSETKIGSVLLRDASTIHTAIKRGQQHLEAIARERGIIVYDLVQHLLKEPEGHARIDTTLPSPLEEPDPGTPPVPPP